MRAREREPEAKAVGLGTLLRTLGPLGPRRVLSRAMRPARAWSRRMLHAAGGRPEAVQWRGPSIPLWPAHEETWLPPGRFRFLGVEQDLGDLRDWRVPYAPRSVWSYHLHYLDGLRQERIPAEERQRLLEAWVAGNPPGTEPAWDPYPTALRLVNNHTCFHDASRSRGRQSSISSSRSVSIVSGSMSRLRS